jgi:threonine/homoserine/homoserine lactone efflux protein
MVIVSSGANHGFRRTIPFVSGATIGFTLLLVVVGFWLLRLVSAYPVFLMYLELVGAAFIVYVGYRIAAASPEISVERQRTPTFVEGFLLQWLNPKAWIACASGAALFSSTNETLIAFIAVYFLICYLSLAAWAVLGDRVAMLLHSRLRMRIFNLTMGAMLIATAGYLVYSQVVHQTA